MTDNTHEPTTETRDSAYWRLIKDNLYEKQAEAWDSITDLDSYIEKMSKSRFASDIALLRDFEAQREALRAYQDSLLTCIDAVYRLRSSDTPTHDSAQQTDQGEVDKREDLHVDTVSGATNINFPNYPTGVRRGETSVIAATDSAGHFHTHPDE